MDSREEDDGGPSFPYVLETITNERDFKNTNTHQTDYCTPF